MTDDLPAPDEFAFQGRTAAEYERFFDLDPGAWSSILDCGAGPGSFAATVGDGSDIVAVDPAYRASASRLRTRSQASIDGLAATFSEISDQFVWRFYDDIDDRIGYLERARERFLADLTGGGRYVAAALPSLPFRADAFDLALSAHFLFLYAEQLGEQFHRRALAELCRVARSELRVYPLRSLAGREPAALDRSLAWLDDAGHAAERREVPFEFYEGANEMLVVTPE